MSTTTKRITDFSISWQADHEQYWQGHGLAFSEYTHCATGCGSTLREAFNDALDSLFQSNDAIVFADEQQEAEMLADLTSQVNEPSMLDMDIVQAKCPEQGEHLGQVQCDNCTDGTLDADTDEERECLDCNGQGTVEDTLEDPDCAVCAGDWHFYVSIDVKVEESEECEA